MAPGDMQFTLTFDRPMQEGVFIGQTDMEFPEYKGHTWSDDRRTLTIRFVTEPATTYGLHIVGDKI